jgi:hypothetical protein
MKRLIRILAGLLRELSDEAAYQRHLEAYGASHSAEEWRRFQNAKLQKKYQRARCC